MVKLLTLILRIAQSILHLEEYWDALPNYVKGKKNKKLGTISLTPQTLPTFADTP
jgi:hypothetical protein